MKRLRTFIITGSVFFLLTEISLAQTDTSRLILASGGVSHYTIVTGADEGPVVQFAAQEMSKYLGLMSGAPFTIQHDTASELSRIILGIQNPLAEKNAEKILLDSIRYDGFQILNIGKDIYITGKIDRGTLYGAYHFLDLYLGVRWYGPDFEVVPSKDTVAVAPMNDIQNPAFIHREVFNHDTDDPYFRQHNRLNGSRMQRDPKYNNYPAGINTWSTYYKGGPSELNDGGHNFYKVVPGEAYHHGGQLLMMDQGCRTEAVNTFKQAVSQYGNAYWYGFSQMDNGWTPDDASKSFASEHGGALSAPMLDMVINVADQVREDYPFAKFATSAYQWSFTPPTGMTVPAYVMIEIAPIQANFGYAYNDPENQELDVDIRHWNDIADNISIWDYITNFQNYLQPLPNIYPMCRNIQYFASLDSVKGYMAEGAYNTSGASFSVLKAWVASRLLWNPDQDYKSLVHEFVNGYYGPAAYYVWQYLETLHASFEATHDKISAKQRLTSPYLNLDFIMKADQLMASADGVAEGAYAKHVHKIRMGVDMTILMLEHLYKAEAEERGISWMEDPDRRARFEAYAHEADVSHYNEDASIYALYNAMNIHRVAPPVPDIAAGLPDSDWIDYQDLDLEICCGANLVEDTAASDHGTVKMASDGVWSTQMSLDLLPDEGKWDLYAYVRTATRSSGNTAFEYGVDPGPSRRVSRSSVTDGKYHMFEFPGNPYSSEKDKYLWFAGSDGSYRLYIDRIVAVRESTSFTPPLQHYDFDLNIYPNPFNFSTTIRYTLRETASVIIHIINGSGQIVRSIEKENLLPGNHQVIFYAGELPAGIYFCKILIRGKKTYIFYKKMIIMK